MASPCKSYWWGSSAAHSVPNFGDALAPLLLDHFSGAETWWSPAAEADVIVTGSILHHMPDNWEGVVLGAGSLYPDSKIPVHADYRAVRGPLTHSLVGTNVDLVLGDPGLLAGELVGQQSRTHAVGVIPHWSDKDLSGRHWGNGAILVDVAADPLEVIRRIASCKRIVTSSLHGVILADAFGIPRRVEVAGLPRFAKEGGDHKFRDHSAAIGLPFKTGEWQSPVFSKVEDLQHGLYDAFRQYGAELRRQQWAAAGD